MHLDEYLLRNLGRDRTSFDFCGRVCTVREEWWVTRYITATIDTLIAIPATHHQAYVPWSIGNKIMDGDSVGADLQLLHVTRKRGRMYELRKPACRSVRLNGRYDYDYGVIGKATFYRTMNQSTEEEERKETFKKIEAYLEEFDWRWSPALVWFNDGSDRSWLLEMHECWGLAKGTMSAT
jgi:hypothetical protein